MVKNLVFLQQIFQLSPVWWFLSSNANQIKPKKTIFNLPHTYHHKVPRVSRESFFVTLKPAKPHIVLDSVEVVGRPPIRATRGPFHLPMSIMLMCLMMMMTMMTSSVWSKMMIMMTRWRDDGDTDHVTCILWSPQRAKLN